MWKKCSQNDDDYKPIFAVHLYIFGIIDNFCDKDMYYNT